METTERPVGKLLAPQPAPMRLRFLVGHVAGYYLHAGYTCNYEAQQFDDTPYQDEFQLPVYAYARQVADQNRLRNVLDVGCGSGYKLVTLFTEENNFHTIGTDNEKTVAWLRSRWPHRRWEVAGEPSLYNNFSAQLVICSDVIEHVVYPLDLFGTLLKSDAQYMVISTPERDELCLGTHDGPPRNPHHIREWNYAQFHALLGNYFNIMEHFVHCGTQIALLSKP